MPKRAHVGNTCCIVHKGSNGKRRTVVLADDDRRLLELAARILAAEYEVVSQVADGLALVEAVERLRPDAAVVDIAMPGLNGIEAVRRFSASSQTVAVYLSGQAGPDLIQQALAAGGLGYVLKASASEDLLPAMQAALLGKMYVSPSLK